MSSPAIFQVDEGACVGSTGKPFNCRIFRRRKQVMLQFIQVKKEEIPNTWEYVHDHSEGTSTKVYSHDCCRLGRYCIGVPRDCYELADKHQVSILNFDEVTEAKEFFDNIQCVLASALENLQNREEPVIRKIWLRVDSVGRLVTSGGVWAYGKDEILVPEDTPVTDFPAYVGTATLLEFGWRDRDWENWPPNNFRPMEFRVWCDKSIGQWGFRKQDRFNDVEHAVTVKFKVSKEGRG